MSEQENTPTEAEMQVVGEFRAHASIRTVNGEEEAEAEARSLIEQIKAEVRADERAKRPDREQIDRIQFEIDNVHQIHGDTCLCGFKSSRSRSRTEHLTALFADAVLALEPEAREERMIECPHWEPGCLTKRKGCTACAAEAREEPKPPKVENLEIINGWLVDRGVHPGEYPAGAAYGMLPDSDAEPLMDLSQIPGWPEPREVTDAEGRL